MKIPPRSSFLIGAALLSLASCSLADPPDKQLDAPGYRPESGQSEAFLEQLPTSRIAVLPGIVRTRDGNLFSAPTRSAAVGFLTRHQLGRPEARELEPDLGAPRGHGQFQLFQNDMALLGPATAKLEGCDASLALVFLVTPTPGGGIAVGGIHVYLLDSQGGNAFSFLLNSHHKAFAKADLRAPAGGPEATGKLVARATTVALGALLDQVESARKPEP